MMVKRLVTRCLVLRTLSSLSMNYSTSSLHSFLHLRHCPSNGETEFQRCSEEAGMSPWPTHGVDECCLALPCLAWFFPSPSTSLPLLCLPVSYFRSVLRLLYQNQLLRHFVRTDIWTELEQGFFPATVFDNLPWVFP